MQTSRYRHWLLILCGVVTGCGLSFSTASDDTDTTGSTSPSAVPSTAPTVEATHTFATALGGVAPGRDEILLADFTTNSVTFQIADDTIVGLLPRTGVTDFAEGNGARIIPQRTGVTKIQYTVHGVPQQESFAVNVPPQRLIQVLMGEVRGLLQSEATITNRVVQLSSTSTTGDAVAATIRNRIDLINDTGSPSLFAADSTQFNRDPPLTAYESVIEAVTGTIFQFSPVDPDDTNHAVYTNAETRSFLKTTQQFAYDQAVLTAASIFDGSTPDPTGGAFAFRSPTPDEAACLESAADSATLIPTGCGPGDSNFPALAPVQILIHPNVGTQSDGRPAFVFYRKRLAGEFAVTKQP